MLYHCSALQYHLCPAQVHLCCTLRVDAQSPGLRGGRTFGETQQKCLGSAHTCTRTSGIKVTGPAEGEQMVNFRSLDGGK